MWQKEKKNNSIQGVILPLKKSFTHLPRIELFMILNHGTLSTSLSQIKRKTLPTMFVYSHGPLHHLVPTLPPLQCNHPPHPVGGGCSWHGTSLALFFPAQAEGPGRQTLVTPERTFPGPMFWTSGKGWRS